jgi:group I intron endonuclease
MIIYKITNILNGKIYIGYTTLSILIRFKTHVNKSKSGSDFLLHKAIRKYGVENFTIEQICECKNFKGLKRMEIFFIKKFNSFYKYNKGYNMTKGGDGNDMNDEIKKKIGMSNKISWNKKVEDGYLMPKEQREKISLNHARTKLSIEHKIKLSKSNKDRIWTKESILKLKHSQTGKRHSEETKNKMRLSQKGKHIGKKHSEESKQKNRQSHLGKVMSIDTIKLMSEKAKIGWQKRRLNKAA